MFPTVRSPTLTTRTAAVNSKRTTFPLPRLLASDLAVALSMGVAGASWLAWLQAAGKGQALGVDELLRSVLTVLAFSVQGVLIAVPLILRALRSHRADGWREPFLASFVCAPVAAAVISAGNQSRLYLFDLAPAGLHLAPAGLPINTMAGDALALLVVLLPVAFLSLGLVQLRSRHFRSRGREHASSPGLDSRSLQDRP